MTTTVTVTQGALPGLKMPELEKLEDKVRKGLGSFVEVGKSLQQIEEKHGYALRGYKDFPAYCEGEFHFSLRQGQRLMLAADTAQKVEKAIGEAPRNEATARVLNPIASEPKLLERVKKELEKKKLTVASVTAEKLQEVVDKIKPQTKSMFEDGAKDTKAAKERESAKAVVAAGLSDVCPGCGNVPKDYCHIGDTWHCGSCNAIVRVSALPFEIATCIDCSAVLLDESGICRRCGSVQ